MPNIKSAIKRVKTNEARRAHNASIKSEMRTAVKKVDALVNAKDAAAATALNTAAQKLDKAANKGLIHKNTASRTKARLAKKVNTVTA